MSLYQLYYFVMLIYINDVWFCKGRPDITSYYTLSGRPIIILFCMCYLLFVDDDDDE